jgi:hypothetical protein
VNRAETYDLLTAIAAVDNRQFDDATVLMWFEILNHVDPADAGAAVAEHFRSSDAYLMPVHIARLADGYAKARNHRERIKAQVIEPAPPVPTEERSPEAEAAIAALRAKTPAGDRDKLRFGSRFWRRSERGGTPVQAFANGFTPPDAGGAA